jgi:hypothetical protein
MIKWEESIPRDIKKEENLGEFAKMLESDNITQCILK